MGWVRPSISSAGKAGKAGNDGNRVQLRSLQCEVLRKRKLEDVRCPELGTSRSCSCCQRQRNPEGSRFICLPGSDSRTSSVSSFFNQFSTMTHKNFSNLTNGTISLEVAGSDGEPWTAELPPNATVQIPEFVLDRGLRMQSGFSMAWSEPISELSANCIDDSSFQASPEAGAGKT
eukprot:111847-Rhodomonas_salina.3